MQMRQLDIPYLAAWDAMNEKIVARFNPTMGKKFEHSAKWRRDLALHPDLPVLGDVQRVLYGYAETMYDETPFAVRCCCCCCC